MTSRPAKPASGRDACSRNERSNTEQGSRHGRRRVPRLPARRAAPRRGSRRLDRPSRRLRPHVDGGHGAAVRRHRAGARLPPRRRGRRHRREPSEPRPLLVREPDDGRARARAGAPPRDAEARRRGDDLRLSEVRPGALPRGRPLERLPGGDERAVRRREEGDPRRRPVVPRSSTGRTRSSCSPSTSTGRATTSTSRPRT